jgi:hypothetical protein
MINWLHKYKVQLCKAIQIPETSYKKERFKFLTAVNVKPMLQEFRAEYSTRPVGRMSIAVSQEVLHCTRNFPQTKRVQIISFFPSLNPLQ